MGAAPIVFQEAPQQAASLKQPSNPSKNNLGATQNFQAQPFSVANEINLGRQSAPTSIEEIQANQSQFQLASTVEAPRPLPNPQLTFLANKNELPHLPNNLGIPVSKQKGLHIVASLHAGLALTGNRLAGDKPNIISDQKALLSWQTAVGLEAVINRNWSVLTGLNYNLPDRNGL
ncbi:MAG: hypothetical protein IPN76_32655 [Saprospiraceae bacterium]|nr:hypothetical protein [Saprospiraceae bacterium]